jgi:hypothetical protein
VVGEQHAGSERYRVMREAIIAYALEWDSRDYHWTRLSLATRRAASPWATLAGLGVLLKRRSPAA